jgi:hypothetical protein
MPHPEDQDPRPSQDGAPLQRDAMDLPPPECVPHDGRRLLTGHEASGVLAGTTAVVVALLLVLDALLPTWSRGILLLLGPALLSGVLARYRLPAGARAALVVLAAAYAAVLLLAIG